jgi:hypothetical protein
MCAGRVPAGHARVILPTPVIPAGRSTLSGKKLLALFVH